MGYSVWNEKCCESLLALIDVNQAYNDPFHQSIVQGS